MVEIREARYADIDTIITLWHELMDDQRAKIQQHQHEHRFDFEEKTQSERMFRRFIKQLLRTDQGAVFLAEDKKQPVGYLQIHISKNIPLFQLEKLGELNDIYVRAPWRGQGISSQLKDEAVRWCKKHNIKKVMLKVLPSNPHARQAYEAWGFSAFILEMRMNL